MCSEEDYYEVDYPENVVAFEEEYPKNVSHFEEEYPKNVSQDYEGEGSLLSNICVGKKLLCLKRGREMVVGQAIKLCLSLCTEYVFFPANFC